MKTIARPLSHSAHDLRHDLTLAPTSMPRVGSSRISDARVGGQPARQERLLLVASAQKKPVSTASESAELKKLHAELDAAALEVGHSKLPPST